MDLNVISIDVGFGETKVVAGRRAYKFPTLLATVNPEGMGRLGKDAKRILLFEHGGLSYAVGDDAATLGGTPVGNTGMLVEHAHLFVRKALHDIKARAGNTTLALGLPVFDMPKYKSPLKKSISSETGIPEQNIYVYPQGLGVLADCNGIGRDIIILDIGYNTIDIIVTAGGKVVPPACGMLRGKGIGLVVSELRNHIQSTYETEMSNAEIFEILRTGEFKLYGRRIDLSVAISSIKNNYVRERTQELVASQDFRMKKADKVVLAGGGAHIITDLGDPRYTPLIHIPKDPEFANARGFYKLATEGARRREVA